MVVFLAVMTPWKGFLGKLLRMTLYRRGFDDGGPGREAREVGIERDQKKEEKVKRAKKSKESGLGLFLFFFPILE